MTGQKVTGAFDLEVLRRANGGADEIERPRRSTKLRVDTGGHPLRRVAGHGWREVIQAHIDEVSLTSSESL